MAKILLADDSYAIREAASTLLRTEFHVVLTASNGEEALSFYREDAPDLIILDVSMPGKSGFDVCREIRLGDLDTPILFLSAKTGETDKVLGLGLGADDYIAKPFGAREFLARISAALRRSSTMSVAPILKNRPHVPKRSFHIGSSFVCAKPREIVGKSGNRVCLTAYEFHILQFFKMHLGEIIVRTEMIEFLWGKLSLLNERALSQHLYNLRRKLEGFDFSIISVPKNGLRIQFNGISTTTNKKGKGNEPAK